MTRTTASRISLALVPFDSAATSAAVRTPLTVRPSITMRSRVLNLLLPTKHATENPLALRPCCHQPQGGDFALDDIVSVSGTLSPRLHRHCFRRSFLRTRPNETAGQADVEEQVAERLLEGRTGVAFGGRLPWPVSPRGIHQYIASSGKRRMRTHTTEPETARTVESEASEGPRPRRPHSPWSVAALGGRI
jgi:hypothetical protein